MKKIYIALLAFSLITCQSNNKDSETQEEKAAAPDMSGYPELLVKALDAHGGLAQWQQFGMLAYDMVAANGNTEHQIINLHNRKVLIDRDSVKIGFDGQEVWVSPNLVAFGRGSARFYHNLNFYFFGMPFLFADPGINYEDLGVQTINDKAYRALKITYDQGVGDTDTDAYIAHFNPETYQMELLLYTVTFYSGEKTDKYNGLVYAGWHEVNGLLVPAGYKGHVFENNTLGKERYQTSFKSVEFKAETPEEALFEIPEIAEIDSLTKY